MSNQKNENTPGTPIVIGPYNATMLLGGLAELLNKAQVTLEVIGEETKPETAEKTAILAKAVAVALSQAMQHLFEQSQEIAHQAMEEDFLNSSQGSRPGFVH